MSLFDELDAVKGMNGWCGFDEEPTKGSAWDEVLYIHVCPVTGKVASVSMTSLCLW